MGYSPEQFEQAVSELGEVFFVLESDREYEVHGTEGYELKGAEKIGETRVRVSGTRDGELLVAEFPLSSIEHHYSHKEI